MPSDYVRQRLAEIRAEQMALAPIRAVEAAKQIKAEKIKEKRRQPGFVYFFRTGNAVKIGFSTNLAERASSLRTSCPEKGFIVKHLPGTIAREREMHKRFSEYRLTGEWFDLRGRLAKYLERNFRPIELPAPIPPLEPEPFDL